MAAFWISERRRARNADDESGFWLVASGHPAPVKERSLHRVTVENQSPWPSANTDAVCEIRYPSQAHNCLTFGSSGLQYFAIISDEPLRKHSPVVKCVDMLRRPPGGCRIRIITTASFGIRDPLLPTNDPDRTLSIVVEYGIKVR